jgi:succinate dehydrogenase/fumarate reductase flavoprotein subunit
MASPVVYAVVTVEVEIEEKEIGRDRSYPGDALPMPHRNMGGTWEHESQRLMNVIEAVYANEEAAQADAAARRAAADAEDAGAWAAWDVNKFTLAKAVAPGDVVHCVVAGDNFLYLVDGDLHVDKAKAKALLMQNEVQEWAYAKLHSLTVG